MKRIFAHIGFSMATALLVLNFISVSVVPVITAALGFVFIVTLCLPVFRKAVALPLCLGSALLACLIFISVYRFTVLPEAALDGEKLLTTFYLTDLPAKTTFGYAYTAKAVLIEKSGAVQQFKFRLTTDHILQEQAYQRLRGELSFHYIADNAIASHGLWGKGIYLTASAKELTSLNETVASPMHFFLQCRNSIITSLTKHIGGERGALAAALITGSKTALSGTVIDDFRMAGVSHLMAVSGLHLTVVAASFRYAISPFHFTEKMKTSLTLVVIFLFAAVTGFSASVVRAGIMMAVLLSADFFHRRGDTLNSLGFAAALLCLNPFVVCDVGAVLSMLSVLALCTLNHRLQNITYALKDYCYKHGGEALSLIGELSAYFLNILLSSFSVLLFNLPAFVIFFEYFSAASLVANIFLLLLGSITTVVSFLTAVLAKLWLLGKVLVALDGALCGLILRIVHLFASGSFSLMRTGVHLGIILAAVLTVLAVSFMLGKERLIRITAIVSACIIVFYQGYAAIQANHSARVFITKSGACVMTCENKTVVAGIRNKSDYYAVSQFLKAEGRTIDIVVSNPNKTKLNCKLTEQFECDTVISSVFSPELLESDVKSYQKVSAYEEQLSDHFSVAFQASDLGYTFTMKAFDVVFTNGTEPDGNIYYQYKTKIISDNYGDIDLTESDVVYTIYKNHTYTARRVDVWEN